MPPRRSRKAHDEKTHASESDGAAPVEAKRDHEEIQYEPAELSDVQFKYKSMVFNLHKAVLARATTMKTMILNCKENSVLEHASACVQPTAEAMRSFVDALYNGRSTVLKDKEQTLQVAELAHYYGSELVRDACDEVLVLQAPSNCKEAVELLTAAEKCKLTKTAAAVLPKVVTFLANRSDATADEKALSGLTPASLASIAFRLRNHVGVSGGVGPSFQARDPYYGYSTRYTFQVIGLSSTGFTVFGGYDEHTRTYTIPEFKNLLNSSS